MRSFPPLTQSPMRSFHRRAVGFAIVLAFLVPGAAPAQDWLYPVKPGEHLWGLAERFLDGHKSYGKLQQLNRIKDPKRIPPGSVLRIPLAWMRRVATEARITATTGDVAIERAGAAARPAGVGDTLRERDRLRTAPGAHAAITLPDGTQVRVLADSEVAVESMATYQNARVFDSRLLVARGRTESIAPTDRDGATRFELRTRAGVTSVRGTVFRVATTDTGDISTTEVLHGRVSAGNSAGEVTVDAGFGTVMATDRAPSPPAALLPAPSLDGLPAKLVRMPVRVDFPALAGAVRYRLQLAADATFSPLLADLATESPAIVLPDLPDGRYAIRVRGIDAQGLEGTDAARDFDIAARPGAPRSEAPPPGALADVTPPRFQWTPDGPADRLRYRFQLARDDAFTQLQADVRDLATPEYTSAEPLPPGVWHWRAAATDPSRGDGPFGETRVLRRPSPPPAPAVIERSPQAIAARWPEGRVRATLAPEAAPQSVVADTIADSGTWSAARPDPGRYVLTTRTIEADGFEGPESTTQVLDVPQPPAPPTPAAPANDALLEASPGAFAWTAPEDEVDGTTYRLQVERLAQGSSASPASDAPIDRDGLTTRSVSAGVLPPGPYRWRVAAATAADGPGRFSAWQAFRVLSEPPGTPLIRRTPGVLSIRWPDATPLEAVLSTEGGGAVFARTVTGGSADLPRPAPGRYVLATRTLEADGFPGRAGSPVTVDLPPPPSPPAIGGIDAAAKPVVAARPTLRWPASAPDAAYRLQIATDTAFAAPLVDRVVGTVTSTTHDATLPPGTYRWRVAAANDPDGPGPYSTPQAFRIDVPAPQMLRASRSQGKIVTQWQAEVPAASYEVQLARDTAFTTIVATGRTTARDTGFTPPAPGEYFARVRGLDADGEPGPFSNVVSVMVPAPLPWWTYLLFLFGLALP
jgi:hypothetical protein